MRQRYVPDFEQLARDRKLREEKQKQRRVLINDTFRRLRDSMDKPSGSAEEQAMFYYGLRTFVGDTMMGEDPSIFTPDTFLSIVKERLEKQTKDILKRAEAV